MFETKPTWSEFNPLDPHNKRREPIPIALSSDLHTLALAHTRWHYLGIPAITL